MRARFAIALLALLRALDILACTLWLAPLYLVGLADRPSGRQMISSYVGKAAANEHRWGRWTAAIIDQMAIWLGDQPDHCRRAYLHYRNSDQ